MEAEQLECWVGLKRWGAANEAVQAGRWAECKAERGDPGASLKACIEHRVGRGSPDQIRRGGGVDISFSLFPRYGATLPCVLGVKTLLFSYKDYIKILVILKAHVQK